MWGISPILSLRHLIHIIGEKWYNKIIANSKHCLVQTDPEEGSPSQVSEDGGEEVVAEEVGHHDPYFEPVVNLPEVTITTHEEEEEVMVKL